MKQPVSIGLLVGISGLFLTCPQPGLAADGSQEISTAAVHAGMAASAPDLKMINAHLHHVVNCLVGPASADFDPAQANPCNGQGNGAMKDSPDKQAVLAAALTLAKSGIAQSDAEKAKAIAAEVQTALKKAGM